ncbi:Matrix metalloproteinase-16 [Manis javanica]|nr:Matrix metalloproteinase-16 [Manis javanica]
MGCPGRCCARAPLHGHKGRQRQRGTGQRQRRPAGPARLRPLQHAPGQQRQGCGDSAPARSPLRLRVRDCGMQRSPSTSAASATAATQAPPRQPATPSNQPDSNGPKARPTPNDVPATEGTHARRRRTPGPAPPCRPPTRQPRRPAAHALG